MPVDYSKWDALELSDDSDFEPHPNVDKRSFIRAKQNQIHQQRADRKARIETLKYERVVNDGLLRRVDALLAELHAREAEARARDAAPQEGADAFLFQALIASAGDPGEDEAPKPPAGVHSAEDGPIRYSQMMGSLVDQVKKEVAEAAPGDWYKAYFEGVGGHRRKVADLQKNLAAELARLEKEEGSKITSESIRDGFNSSHVRKDPEPPAGKGKAVQKVEVLNPAALSRAATDDPGVASSGAEGDIDEDISALAKDNSGSGGGGGAAGDDDDDDEEVQASATGKQFARIPEGDYEACLRFISAHREVLAERETDGLLVMGFDAQMRGKEAFARQCVHQALLLQYCRTLGPDGVRLFFRRIATADHQARRVFLDDVGSTYQRIRTRTKELAAERAADAGAGVEQIQLQAVEPGTTIHINVPDAGSEDPAEVEARRVFDTFPPNFQKALQTGDLDRVNEVLGKMSVEEAEEVVGQLGESGMLDMREGVIDGTTDEGREELRRIHDDRDPALDPGIDQTAGQGPTPDPE